MNLYQNRFAEKLREALTAVSPTIGIVLLLSFTIAPIPPSILLLFLFGAVMLIVGMMFFTLGAELAMTPVGERIGTRIAQSRKLGIVLLLCFVLGFVITISEPDLQVLAEQVPSVPNAVLIVAVAAGVGVFLMIAMLRMLFSKTLRMLLIMFYLLIFALAFFVPDNFSALLICNLNSVLFPAGPAYWYYRALPLRRKGLPDAPAEAFPKASVLRGGRASLPIRSLCAEDQALK